MIVKKLKNGVDDKKSIYQIKIENNNIIKKSISTLYGYINKGYLTTKRIDLPYAVTYKKQVILILIILLLFTNIQVSMFGN